MKRFFSAMRNQVQIPKSSLQNDATPETELQGGANYSRFCESKE